MVTLSSDFVAPAESRSHLHRQPPLLETPRRNRDAKIYEQEKLAIEFFLLHTRGLLVGRYPRSSLLPSWADYTIASIVTEPAVRYAIAAMGNAHASTEDTVHTSLQRQPRSEVSQLTMQFYGQSLLHLQRLVGQASAYAELIEPVIACCTLLIILEVYLGNDAGAVQHSRFGRRVMQQHLNGSTPVPGSTMQYVYTGMSLVGSDSLSKAPRSAGQHSYGATRREDTTHLRSLQAKISLDERLEAIVNAGEKIMSQLLDIAGDQLDRGTTWHSLTPSRRECLARSLSRSVSLADHKDLERNIEQTMYAHEVWRNNAWPFFQDRPTTPALILLELRCFISDFNLATCRTMKESDVDGFHGQFTFALELVEAYFANHPFTRVSVNSANSASTVVEQPHNVGIFDFGIVSTLLTVASKCRTSAVRHKAMNLLHYARSVEHVHAIQPLEITAATTVELEEDNTANFWHVDPLQIDQPPTWSAEQVPEQARFSDVVFSVDEADDASTRLVCAYSTRGPDGSIHLLETTRGPSRTATTSELVYHI